MLACVDETEIVLREGGTHREDGSEVLDGQVLGHGHGDRWEVCQRRVGRVRRRGLDCCLDTFLTEDLHCLYGFWRDGSRDW